MKFKQMIYKEKPTNREILATGEYKGYIFYIVSYGTHPCAYVRVNTHKDWEEIIDCHGGITFNDSAFEEFENKGEYIGWDYNHCHDFSGCMPEFGGKRWTTEEIYEDVKNVIEQVVLIEKK